MVVKKFTSKTENTIKHLFIKYIFIKRYYIIVIMSFTFDRLKNNERANSRDGGGGDDDDGDDGI